MVGLRSSSSEVSHLLVQSFKLVSVSRAQLLCSDRLRFILVKFEELVPSPIDFVLRQTAPESIGLVLGDLSIAIRVHLKHEIVSHVGLLIFGAEASSI